MVRVVDRDEEPVSAPRSPQERARRWSTFQPWLQRDPLPYWTEMRNTARVVHSEELGGYWILTRYEDIEWAARHPEVFSNAEIGLPHRQIYKDKLIPIQLDGEDHRHWRQTLTALFNPSAVNRLTPEIRRVALAAIAPIIAWGSCEFVAEFAVPLPSETFLVNFGIDREYLPALLDHKDWLRREGLPKATSDEELHSAGRPLWEFFSQAVERLRAAGPKGRTDVISRLLMLRYQGRALTHDEIVNIILMTMFASLDTTNSMLGLIFLYLAEHPETQRLIVEQPDRIPLLVEELIRHEAMVSTARVVVQDVEVAGVTMRRGDRVLMSWGLAGHDPMVFDRPEEVDLDRPSMRHLAFGVGPHRCLGMHLARRIITVALREWHARIPRYEPTAGHPRLRYYSPIRGVESLHLTLLETRDA
jgi:cytochrome P450